jgi:hypothetical protein
MENPQPPAIPPSSNTPSAAKPYPGAEPSKPRGNGRGWILALAIMQALGGFFIFVTSRGTLAPEAAAIVLATMLGLSAIFFGLWFWGKKSPFAALLTTLIIFVTFHLLDAVLDPMSLARGIFVKIIMLVGLSTALKAAYTKKREAELQASQS